ncbi:MAG: PEP-CTERM sorting domain-containing protein [Geobacteraceae bacterium]|nr:PEP-CTERM sorting domain-containing protein [Geobacteraceae bacterium]
MKKKLIALLAGALLTVAMAGNALAYFEQGHIIRVVYNQSTMTEVATDLGAASTVLAGGTFGGGADSFLNYGSLGSAAVGDLKVTYFGVTIGSKDLWLSSNAATQSVFTTSWSASSGTIGSVLSRYAGLGGSSNTLGMSDANSYWVKEDANGTKVGKFNTFYSAANGEIALGALDTVGYTTQNLFFWDNPSTTGQGAGVKTVTLKTLADGSTQVVATPIPPAFMLMGSGLLGLVGIRRKFNK